MDIIEIIFPISDIAIVGYVAARLDFLKHQECDAIAKLVFSILIPALLFSTTAKAEFPENMAWEFFFAYYTVALGIYVLAIGLSKYVYGYNEAEQSVFGMGAAYGNITIIGIPVCTLALGAESLIPLFVIISIHNLVLFSLGIVFAERNTLTLATCRKDLFALLKQLLTSPITGSLIAGGIVNYLDLSIVSPLEKVLTLFANAAVPIALFVLGTSLHRYSIKGNLGAVGLMVALKMLLFPFLIWLLLFNVFSVDALWASTALIAASLPVGVSVYVFSKKYQACEAQIAAGIMISTVMSGVSLSVVLFFI